jgi:uncharacterized protein
MRDRQEDGSIWHQGELAIQERAGVLPEAKRLQEAIHSTIPDPFRAFIATQRFAVLGTIDPQERLWASLCTGEPGFMHCPDRFSVHVKAGSTDKLAIGNVKTSSDVGMLVIDFAHRRRIRINGEAEVLNDGALQLHAKQIYSNCPRYIQQRTFEGAFPAQIASSEEQTAHLNKKQIEIVQKADTLFIASAHREFGVDVSHRGGNPGFVRVESKKHLVFPDYNGNKMFNTLGNISTNPTAGLLFPDFADGNTLQITGRVTIEWDPAALSHFPGAERVLTFDIDAVVTHDAKLPRYHFEGYSPHNPT